MVVSGWERSAQECQKESDGSELLGMLLEQLGYRAVTRRSRNERLRGWIVYQRDSDEISSMKKLFAT